LISDILDAGNCCDALESMVGGSGITKVLTTGIESKSEVHAMSFTNERSDHELVSGATSFTTQAFPNRSSITSGSQA
jgi:hypothetical protein